jgi:hypothetical protein
MRSTCPVDIMLFGPIAPKLKCEVSTFLDRRMAIFYICERHA